jgi:phytoene synthase
MSAAAVGSEPEQASYCAALVRERNIDRYLATLFLPSDNRRDVYALYAFDAEITHIRSMIKEPMMGEIRLQWWREIIGGERAGEAANNPVASDLLRAIDTNNLPSMGFDNYLKARVFDLYSDPMPDTGTFEGYAGETLSFLFFQAASIMARTSGISIPDELAECAGHAGVAWVIVDILKNLPIHRSRGQCYISGDILNKAGATQEDYYSADNKDLMALLVEDMVMQARRHQHKFRAHFSDLPIELKPAFLPMCLMTPYLSRFKKMAIKTAHMQVDIAQWRKQIYLWHAARNGRY